MQELARHLACEVKNNTIQMGLHPGCIRLSEHKFQTVMIGRQGPGAPGPSVPPEPWVHSKPTCVTLYFELREGTEAQVKFAEQMKELEKVDAIYINPHDGVAGRMDVCCDVNTCLYQELDRLGLIESTTPQWYKDGQF